MEAATDRLALFLVPHRYLTVFAVSAVDAIGIPFPGSAIGARSSWSFRSRSS